MQAIKRGREDLIIDVKLSMAQSAKGFYYKETTETIVEDENGTKKTTVIYNRFCTPNVLAQSRTLANYDSEWSDDPKAQKLKERAQDFKEKFAETNNAIYALMREGDKK